MKKRKIRETDLLIQPGFEVEVTYKIGLKSLGRVVTVDSAVIEKELKAAGQRISDSIKVRNRNLNVDFRSSIK